MARSRWDIAMLVGHLGVALAAKVVEPRVGLGTLFLAALLPDLIGLILVPLGIEHGAHVPSDFAVRHVMAYDLAYSHSLLAVLAFSIAAALVWAGARSNGRLFALAPAVIVATVFSHWALDLCVHRPELTLWGPLSPRFGLALYDNQPQALLIELALTALGLALFLLAVKSDWGRRLALLAVLFLVACITAFGALATDPPPKSGIIGLVFIVAIVVAGAAVNPRNGPVTGTLA